MTSKGEGVVDWSSCKIVNEGGRIKNPQNPSYRLEYKKMAKMPFLNEQRFTFYILTQV